MSVIADVAVESEAHLALVMRAAQAIDRAPADPTEALPRVSSFRSQNSGSASARRPHGIWEGSGNVICLDLLRVLRREPQVREALRGEIRVEGSAVLNKLWRRH
jgi:putative acyl-CoA dehydrogenase